MNYVPRNPQIPVYQQIKAFVQGLAQKRNQKVILNEVQSLINQLGIPGEQYFLLQLLESIEIQKEKQSLSQKGQFLIQYLQQATAKSHFLDYFCGVVEAVCPQSQSIPEYLNELCNSLKIPPLMQMIMWLSVTFSSNASQAKEGVKNLKKKLQETFQQKNNIQVPTYIIHSLLYQLRNIQELADFEPEIKNFNEYVSNTKQAELKCLYDDSKKSMKLDPINIEIPKINECVKPVDILKELGPYTINLQQLFNEYSDSDIMDCLLYLANNQWSPQQEEINKDVQQLFKLTQNTYQPEWELFQNDYNKQQEDDFIKFFVPDNKRQWSQIFEQLDRPNLELSQSGFNNIMQMMNRIKKIQPQFQLPHRLLFEKWHNKKSQLLFLTLLLKVGKPEQVFWNEYQKKHVIMEHQQNYKPTQAMQYWYSLEFIQMMIELSEYGYISEIREFFEFPIKHNPDLVILSLFQIQPQQGGALIDELFTILFPNYVSQHANSSPLLEQMWKNNQNLFITGISELYKKELGKKENSCLNLSRVLDIVQQLFLNSTQNQTSLLAMAKFEDYQFSVPLGILAGKREYLNFDVWINERIKTEGVPFVTVLLQYIEENVISQIKELQQKSGLASGQLGQMQIQQLDYVLDKAQMKLEMISIAFEQLMAQSDKLGNKIKQTTQQFYKEIVQVFPQLAGEPNPKANQEVENKTDKYFDSFYNETISLEYFLNLMMQWKNTGSIQEKEVFACIITNLYNEYQYHLKYPKKELELTGQLFGGVLERGLVDLNNNSTKSVKIGLQIILVSLQSNTQRYDFAVKALEMLKNKIYEWPSFATDVMQNEQLALKNPDLLADIIRVCEKNGIKCPQQPQFIAPIVQPPIQVVQKPVQVITAAPKIEEEPIIRKIEPQQQQQQQQPQQQQPHNLQSITPPPTHIKVQPLPVQHTPQPQKQQKQEDCINLSFKNILNIEFEQFVKNIIDQETKEQFTFILNNISQTNVEQKAVEIRSKLDNYETQQYFFKNIAYQRAPMQQQQAQAANNIFLLLATLNKNKYFTEIAKDIGIGLTKLLTVNRTSLQQEDRSILKNMGHFLGLITISRDKPFLFKYFDYKTLLKKNNQTVYPLCKILESVKQSKIFTTNNKWISRMLHELISIKEQCQTMAKYDIMNLLNTIGVPQLPNPEPVLQPVPSYTPPVRTTPQPIPSSSVIDPHPYLNIKNLPQYVMADPKNLNDKISIAECKTLVAQALDHAIADIIPPVISRSVTIALITTRELVFKDFAQEPNEKHMLKGMHLIASHLSGSLAMVTCREPLKVRITHYLKEATDSLEVEQKIKENFVTSAASENLDLGCALIKKAVIERALEDVNQDPLILSELERRQKFKEKGQIYRDEHALSMTQSLPIELQPRQTGLCEEELRIYEEFGTKKKQIKQPPASKVSQLCQLFQEHQIPEEKVCPLVQDLQEFESNNLDQYRELADRFLQLIFVNNMSMEKIIQILDFIQSLISKITDKLNQKWSDLVEQFIKKSPEALEPCPLWWQAFPIMLNKKLITTIDAEKILQHIINKDQSIMFNSIVNILRQVIITEDNGSYVQAFRNLIKEISKKKDTNTQVNKFFQELQTYVSNQQTSKISQKKINLVKSFYPKIDEDYALKVLNKLRQWYQITSEEDINQFFREGDTLFFAEDQISKFCAYAIELSMTDASKEYMDHSYIEQLGKMFTIIAKGQVNEGKQRFFDKFFEGYLMVLTKSHEQNRPKFNQRQHFKLLYNLLFDFQILDKDSIKIFHNKFAEFLEKVEPSNYPGFSYAWLELLCNRYFQQIIESNEVAYARLIVKLLEFVRETINDETIHLNHVLEYLRGVTRLFMMLLTDYRKFCCKYAFTFADEVPFNHVQLLSMSLAAYPNDQIDDPQSCTNIYEIKDSQEFGEIVHASLEEQLFLKIKEDIQIMMNLQDDDLKVKVMKYFEYDPKIKLPVHVSGFFIVLPRQEQNQKATPSYQLLNKIIKVSSLALRNTIINIILNQIRYPEKQTEFYLRYILQQFIVGDNQIIQEHFTTLIMRRFLAENPKTWGMLYLHEDLMRTQSPHNLYTKFQIQRQA